MHQACMWVIKPQGILDIMEACQDLSVGHKWHVFYLYGVWDNYVLYYIKLITMHLGNK